MSVIVAVDEFHAPEEVGGKAHALWALARAGFAVPPFFVIKSNAHETGVGLEGDQQDQFEQELQQALASLPEDCDRFAVRSSAAAEDGENDDKTRIAHSGLGLR